MSYQKKYLPLIIGLALAVGFWLGGLFHMDSGPTFLADSQNKQKLGRLIDYIDYEYVDEVNTDSIVDVTVNKILENLDPHSVYIPKKNLSSVTESMNGEFVGIGVSFYVRKDTIAIIKAIEGGPGEKVGLQPGDKILMADEDTLYGPDITSKSVVKKLKGAIDSKVKLKVYRPAEDKHLEVVVTRDLVPIKSVPVYYKMNDGLGYIKVNRFAETTYKEFKTALKDLKKQGVTSLVLDLRGNPGGLLDKANKIVDEFLGKDKLIMFTKNKSGKIVKYYSSKKGIFESGQVFVLIDENSASASEIVAGALQDNDRGVIMGRRSFGKGLVQREMKLGDGSAVRLTVSRYYTPTGRSIQKPYKNKSEKDYYDEYTTRYISGELSDSTKIQVADSLKFTTPKGKIVYGGGGIIPDVFVPLKTGEEFEKVDFAVQSSMIHNFVFDALEKDRGYYNNLGKAEFLDSFEVSDALLEDFKRYINIRTRGDLIIDFTTYDEKIKQYIKSTIASQLFDEATAQRLKEFDDEMLQKVIEKRSN